MLGVAERKSRPRAETQPGIENRLQNEPSAILKEKNTSQKDKKA
jgi:hypothetical protein